MDVLVGYDWPGNVRELENVIERAVILEDSEVITVEALPDTAALSRVPVRSGSSPTAPR